MAKRALSVRDVLAYKPRLLEFDGKWLASIGKPELTGSWMIWGNSSNGKTSFCLQLAKYLSKFGRVAYNSLEEGMTGTIQRSYRMLGITDTTMDLLLLDRESIEDLKIRLRKRRSPNIIFIDTLQYTGMSYKEYLELINEFRSKLFIFVSHAKGAEPKGAVAEAVRYDSNVKMFVESFHTIPQSRYGGGEPYIIWQKGYDDFVEYK